MHRLQLIIEAATENGQPTGFWGRVTFEDNLLIEQADTVEVLQANMRQLLFDFHDLEAVEFELAYDLHAFFEQYDYLKISKIAHFAGMNPSLLRHYKSQTKYPSAEQVQRIETAVHQLASELSQVHLVAA
ncbi:hypothetical protein [Fibrella aquatilis]|uniref:Uncharacterized protein n=1 Tax=Fibrella aquatilis TaxID=2817059 RepID=A0A939G1V4_9BACT|nr:hypothetical protein [Fibrella aquatilis]MBO0929540.1 hypothetical protein [Fibrella aquatilis]